MSVVRKLAQAFTSVSMSPVQTVAQETPTLCSALASALPLPFGPLRRGTRSAARSGAVTHAPAILTPTPYPLAPPLVATASWTEWGRSPPPPVPRSAREGVCRALPESYAAGGWVRAGRGAVLADYQDRHLDSVSVTCPLESRPFRISCVGVDRRCEVIGAGRGGGVRSADSLASLRPAPRATAAPPQTRPQTEGFTHEAELSAAFSNSS